MHKLSPKNVLILMGLCLCLVLLILPCTGCYSYYAYRLSPDKVSLAGWELYIYTSFMEGADAMTNNPVTLGNDTLRYKWYLVIQEYFVGDKSDKKRTLPVIDSIQLVQTGNNGQIIKAIPIDMDSQENKSHPKTFYSITYGTFEIPKSFRTVELNIYVKVISLLDSRVIESRLINTKGELGKIRKVWLGT
jgi:hypothetical protein